MATYSERDRIVIAKLSSIRIDLYQGRLIADDEAIKNRLSHWIKEIDHTLDMISEDDGRDV